MIKLLRNESLEFGIIMNLVQKLEIGIEGRVRRTVSVEQQVQESATAGFEVKAGRKTAFIKIGNRW